MLELGQKLVGLLQYLCQLQNLIGSMGIRSHSIVVVLLGLRPHSFRFHNLDI
jgi:hypothetical protein